MNIFFDTSALVKRYVEEAGSERVQTLCEQADNLILSIICLPELISTFCRLTREGKLDGSGYQQIRQWLLKDFRDIDICEITPQAMRHAIRCLERYPLRAMDALHVGCALTIDPDSFVSADRRQLQAARGEGLPVIEIL